MTRSPFHGSNPSGKMFGDMTIRNKLMTIIMVSTTVAVILLTISSIFYDHILSKNHLVEALKVQSRMVAENCLASLIFDDTHDATQILETLGEIQAGSTDMTQDEINAQIATAFDDILAEFGSTSETGEAETESLVLDTYA